MPTIIVNIYIFNILNYLAPGTPSCGIGLFPCDGSKCIAGSKRCNLHIDCFDGTDEEYCDIYNSSFVLQVCI